MTPSGDPPLIATVRDLSRAECLAALNSKSLGRLAVTENALPVIVPVSFAMSNAHVVFRTRQGGLLDRTCRNNVVAFQVDDYDPTSRLGWSVLVVGIANVLYAGDWLRAVELGLPSVGAGDGAVFVKIVPGIMTGRSIEDDAAVVSASAHTESAGLD